MNKSGQLYLPADSRIFVAGHTGLVGSALVRTCRNLGFTNLILRGRSELNLENQPEVEAFFDDQRPEYVLLAAAKVGGILANSTAPADFIYSNLLISANVIHSSWRHRVKRLIYLGSSCIYPRNATQPIKEEYLLSDVLEPTNEAYAVAKIAGVKLCHAYNMQYGTEFVPVMPTNLYGPGDNFDLDTSHVLPALLRKIHEAKVNEANSVQIWGTGKPMREFLYVDDVARACLFLLGNKEAMSHDLYNIGWGKDISIKDLAELIAEVVGWRGNFVFDDTRPDGTPRKVLDVSRISQLGWRPMVALRDGIELTYRSFLNRLSDRGNL